MDDGQQIVIDKRSGASGIKDRGLDITASSPEEFVAHLQSELEKWGSAIKEKGMRAD